MWKPKTPHVAQSALFEENPHDEFSRKPNENTIHASKVEGFNWYIASLMGHAEPELVVGRLRKVMEETTLKCNHLSSYVKDGLVVEGKSKLPNLEIIIPPRFHRADEMLRYLDIEKARGAIYAYDVHRHRRTHQDEMYPEYHID